jgi:hypothetical protein
MTENAKNEEVTSATETQQDVTQASDTKAEASDELSEDDLAAVAGGRNRWDDPPTKPGYRGTGRAPGNLL